MHLYHLQVKNFELQPLEKKFLEDQIEAFNRFLIPNSCWRVNLARQKELYLISIFVKSPYHHFKTLISGPDLLSHLQKAFDKLYKQIVRHRRKTQQRRLRQVSLKNISKHPYKKAA